MFQTWAFTVPTVYNASNCFTSISVDSHDPTHFMSGRVFGRIVLAGSTSQAPLRRVKYRGGHVVGSKPSHSIGGGGSIYGNGGINMGPNQSNNSSKTAARKTKKPKSAVQQQHSSSNNNR
jgi:hypothetical protein